MIKSLEIENFQGHKRSSLTFSEGVNVIKGPSHSGKTSIIRALKWALQNKPDGDSFRSWTANKKEEIKVAVEFDNSFLIRKRDKDFNGYKIPDDELEALRGSVPEEIEQISNMTDVNLQTQHEGYFMLQDSPANALKRINEIVGLTVIDETLKKANQKINKYNSDARHTKERIEELHNEIEGFNYLDFAGKLINKTQQTLEEYDLVGYKIRVLKHIVSEIDRIRSEIKQHEEFLEAEEVYKKCIALVNDIKAAKYEASRLSRIILEIEEHRKLIKGFDKLLLIQTPVSEMKSIAKEIRALRSEHRSLKSILHSAEKARKQQNDASSKLSQLEKRYDDMLSELGICPLCGQEIQR